MDPIDYLRVMQLLIDVIVAMAMTQACAPLPELMLFHMLFYVPTCAITAAHPFGSSTRIPDPCIMSI